MITFRRLSGRASAVVLALAEQPATWRHGYELCQRLRLAAGSVYPMLMRLAAAGRVDTPGAWVAPAAPPPPRHRYRLTGPGLVLAGRLAAEPPARPTPAPAVGGIGRPPRLEGT